MFGGDGVGMMVIAAAAVVGVVGCWPDGFWLPR